MENVLFKVNFIPEKKMFSFVIGANTWELLPEEYFNLCQNIFQNGDINLDFKKNPTSGVALTKVTISGSSNKVKKGIVEYLKKVKGSYQLLNGINDGQNKHF